MNEEHTSNDAYNRIKRLEEATDKLSKNDEQLNETVNELVINTKLMSNILERMTNQLEPRITKLEEENFHIKMEQSAHTMVIKAVKWLTAVASLGALGTAGSFLLKGAGIS